MAELRLYSKSGVEKDWRCPRSRYWGYEYKGKGLTSGATHLELFLGQILHDGLAGFARGIDIEPIAEAARTQMLASLLDATTGEIDAVNFAWEQASLVEGLLRGFYKHVWSKMVEQYPKVVMIEQPMVFKHDGLGFMAKPDLVMQDKEGSNWYIEYKSTSSKKEGWVNSWDTAIQLHSTVRAIEATIGEPITGVIVQGLYKGFESYGKQSSPFCYAYRRNGNPPFSATETRYDYAAGFKRVPTWELPGGVAAWVDGMPATVLGDQFPQTPPIFIKDDLVNAFFEQRKWREQEIKLAGQMIEMCDNDEATQDVLNVTFPQRFDQCVPSFGKPCSFLKLCHGPKVDPLTAGYSWRDETHLEEFRKLATTEEVENVNSN